MQYLARSFARYTYASKELNMGRRFTVEGFCGGEYAGVYDRECLLDVSEYTEKKGLTRGQLDRIADELNAKYAIPAQPAPVGRELREVLRQTREFIVVACGQEAPYVRMQLKFIDAALDAHDTLRERLTVEQVKDIHRILMGLSGVGASYEDVAKEVNKALLASAPTPAAASNQMLCAACGTTMLMDGIPGQLYCPKCQPAPPVEARAAARVPSLWRIERCTKHEDYDPQCPLCAEEILTVKTERAYLAGWQAAEQAGRCEMLRWVVSSLRDYPNGGGDKEVMAEVERIEQAGMERAAQLVELAEIVYRYTPLPHNKGLVRNPAEELAAAIRALAHSTATEAGKNAK
jgi:hypothetical protein